MTALWRHILSTCKFIFCSVPDVANLNVVKNTIHVNRGVAKGKQVGWQNKRRLET